jgi:hypothetical protein
MNMFFVTMYVGQGLNTDITKGVFDRLRSLPIARWAPLSGRILADMVKQAWSIVLLLVVGFILGFRLGTSVAGLAAAFLLIMFFALCFSWVTVLVGVLAKDPEKVQLFGFTALFPVTFLSAVFVPIDTMPGWLQPRGKGQPGHHPQRCCPRSHGRRTGRSSGAPLADLGRRDRSRLRPAVGSRPAPPRLSPLGILLAERPGSFSVEEPPAEGVAPGGCSSAAIVSAQTWRQYALPHAGSHRSLRRSPAPGYANAMPSSRAFGSSASPYA